MSDLTITEKYAAAVLDVVRCIPPGRAMTYGLIAEIVAERLGRGGPRQVGAVMSRSGDRYVHLNCDDSQSGTEHIPWWRVVNAAGSPPQQHLGEALTALRAEGCPLSQDGRRVLLRQAVWFPEGQ